MMPGMLWNRKEAILLRLAIVDDNMDEIHMAEMLIRDWCSEHNMTVCCDTFTEGDAFLLSAASNSYDLVLFDIYLDEENGIDLAVSFRKISPKTPIVFLTSSSEYHVEALHVHAFDYLQKPITKDAIQQLLDDLLAVRPASEAHLFLTEVPLILHDHLCQLQQFQ